MLAIAKMTLKPGDVIYLPPKEPMDVFGDPPHGELGVFEHKTTRWNAHARALIVLRVYDKWEHDLRRYMMVLDGDRVGWTRYYSFTATDLRCGWKKC